jgi:hypothetical protein
LKEVGEATAFTRLARQHLAVQISRERLLLVSRAERWRTVRRLAGVVGVIPESRSQPTRDAAIEFRVVAERVKPNRGRIVFKLVRVAH